MYAHRFNSSLVLIVVCIAVLCGVITAAAAPTLKIDAITSVNEVVQPQKSSNVPDCLPKPYSAVSLAALDVAILFADGASAYDTTVALQYFEDRGTRNVTLVCDDSAFDHEGINGTVLLDEYFPKYVVNTCVNLSTYQDLLAFDVVVLPSGFASTSSLRVSTAFNEKIKRFALADSKKRLLLTVRESAETLLDSGVLEQLTATTSGIAPTTTVMAYAARNYSLTTCEKGSSVPPAACDVTLTSLKAQGSASVIIASGPQFLTTALARAETWFVALTDQPLVNRYFNCTMWPSQTTPIVVSAANFTTVAGNDATFLELAKGTNTQASNITVEASTMRGGCKNTVGIDFCQGRVFALLVAHGSHDLEVLSIIDTLTQVYGSVHVVCPSDEVVLASNNGVTEASVYLMPFPPRTVTYKLRCTAFYNMSDMVVSGAAIVPGGVVATHRKLQFYSRLTDNIPQFGGDLSLYGSAMILLQPRDKQDYGMYAVVASPFTTTDLGFYGYTVLDDTVGTLSFQNLVRARSRVLGGYPMTSANVTRNYREFLVKTVTNLVFNTVHDMSDDKELGGIFLSVGACVILFVVVVSCLRVRAERQRQRYIPADEACGDDQTEQKYSVTDFNPARHDSW